ncbi:MAG TPA: S-adenosylmethionine:tRNA ribosyltransferase-isomerase [Pseudonocardiaceae bacterium]
MSAAPTLSFELPGGLAATEPPEARGLRRDGVRLLVARPDGLRHARFTDLADHLAPGDLVVVNTSPTLAAAVDLDELTLHVAGRLDDGDWVVELRDPGPVPDARAGRVLALPGGVRVTLVARHPEGGATSERLWRARADGDLAATLAAHGRPIAYGYVPRRWPLEAYQTVFAQGARRTARKDGAARPGGTVPGEDDAAEGSAEMPSAGRPFSTDLVTRLVSRGVTVAPLSLHTGLSSPEKHEPPQAERFTVPAATARLVNTTRAAGGRVVAVGTTVTRALETLADERGVVSAGGGVTELVLDRHRPARAVTGLISGWHEPGASHLMLLEAVAGRRLVARAYAEAVRERYLWHEFGDSCLLLP